MGGGGGVHIPTIQLNFFEDPKIRSDFASESDIDTVNTSSIKKLQVHILTFDL